MTTTKTVTKVPQSFTLNQIGVDDIVHSYTYKYEEDNGTWGWNVYTIPSETGILTPIDDTNKPKNVYTISSPSSVTCNVSPDCCKTVEYKTGSTDFPFLDIEVDCFYTCNPCNKFETGYNSYPDYFYNHRCGNNKILTPIGETYPWSGVDFYYGADVIGKVGLNYIPYSGEYFYDDQPIGYTNKQGPRITQSYTDNTNNTISIESQQINYYRPNKLYPNLFFDYLNFGTVSRCSTSECDGCDDCETDGYIRYYKYVGLIYGIYIDWDSYMKKVGENLPSKYSNNNIEYTNNMFLIKNKTHVAAQCLCGLFGNFNDNSTSGIQVNIMYRTEVNYYRNNSLETKIYTNLDDTVYKLINYCDLDGDNYTKNKKVFDAIIECFSPNDNEPKKGSYKINICEEYSGGENTCTLDTFFESGLVFDTTYGLSSDSPFPLDVLKYKPIFSLMDIPVYDIFKNIEIDKSKIKLYVNSKIAVIHRQLNFDENDPTHPYYVYGVKVYNKSIPISVYGVQTEGTDNPYVIGIDYPILKYNSNGYPNSMISASGILGTYNSNLSSSIYAGTLYSFYGYGDFKNGISKYHYIKSDEDNNQFICTGSCNGSTLTWTSNSRY